VHNAYIKCVCVLEKTHRNYPRKQHGIKSYGLASSPPVGSGNRLLQRPRLPAPSPWLFGREIPILPFSETVAGFWKLVELCKGLVVVPYLVSSVGMNGKS
jgi:hypothetical protein